MNRPEDKWKSGDPYEYFMGRWSRLMAPRFLEWLNYPPHQSWLDLGCGTGALSEAILLHARPSALSCIDPSAGFLAKARDRLQGQADLFTGSSSEIPKPDHSIDIVVSGLALNFFDDLDKAFSEMKRVLKPGGTLAAYVWDYAGRMDFLRLFWDAAAEADPGSRRLDEGLRFPICNQVNLRAAFEQAGLSGVETTQLDIQTVFTNFTDYWNPFTGGQGPAPGYLATLPAELQLKIKSLIQNKIQYETDGSIKLLARALAARGFSKG